MDWIEETVEDLANIKDLSTVCVADETGAFIDGNDPESAEEFAAILTYISQAGQTVGEVLGLSDMESCTVSSKKQNMVICHAQDYLIGTTLSDKAVLSRAEKKVLDTINQRLADLEE